jgi:hypothetical protein
MPRFGGLMPESAGSARHAARPDAAHIRRRGDPIGVPAWHVAERGVVLVRVRVDLCPEPLGIEVDLLAVPGACAFERHVLHDMADAVQTRAFVLTAAAHEDAHAGCNKMGKREHDHAHAVVECGEHCIGGCLGSVVQACDH